MAAKRPAYKAKQTMSEKVIKNKTSKYKFIKVLKRNKICQIQLDRPDFLNAINIEMAQEITDTLIDVEMDR
jgi:1,4-dihydroxy-2-naphthoyl-CoA synthase